MHPWRERLNRWMTPLARRMPLSPNAISIVALLLNGLAAVCLLAAPRRPLLFFAAIAIIAIAGFADALDGIVARVQQKATRFGDFLDHCADRLADALLATAWLAANGVRLWLLLAAVIGVTMNGYAGTQIEATFGQRNYDSVGRGEFVLALVVFPIVSYILFRNGWSALRFGPLTIAEWLAAALLAFAILGVAQRVALAKRLEQS